MNDADGLVVDASVAVKWHLRDEELVDEAVALLGRFVAGAIRLSAPAFIRYEVAQTLERACRDDRIGGEAAVVEWNTFLGYGIHAAQDGDGLVALAGRVARETGASVYDAVYVAYAELLGFGLVTHDERLIRNVEGYPVTVHHLSEAGALL